MCFFCLSAMKSRIAARGCKRCCFANDFGVLTDCAWKYSFL